MSAEVALQIVQTLAVLAGVIFGLDQLRHLRKQQEMQGGAELLRMLQTPDIGRAMLIIEALPDNLSRDELKAHLKDDWSAVIGLLAVFESIGPLIARGHVSIAMYEDFYRGATAICWRRLKPYCEEQRAAGWSNFAEWFQWLAERMEERAPLSSDVPAFKRYAAWRQPADFEHLRGGGAS